MHTTLTKFQEQTIKKGSKVPFFKGNIVYPKLTIGQPNDKYEQEADAMADKVMTMREDTPEVSSDGDGKPSAIQTKSIPTSFVQRKCRECEKEEEGKLQTKLGIQGKEDGEEEEMVHPKSDGSGGMQASSQLQSQLQASKGGGSPLPPATNQFMGNAFGTDFSHVRVHTNSQAQQMNQGIQAKAFTHGSDIYFNSGMYDASSNDGKRLLAHELAHVTQKTSASNIQMESNYRCPTSSCHVHQEHYGRGRFKITQRYPRRDKINRNEEWCFEPSIFLGRKRASKFGDIAEKFIQADYCNQMGCQPFLVPGSNGTDYFDNRVGGSSVYLAFLKYHNPHLTNQQLEEMAKSSFIKDHMKRPDILTHLNQRKEFYEIKPNSYWGIRGGSRKIALLHAFYQNYNLAYNPGTSYSPKEYHYLGKVIADNEEVKVYLHLNRYQDGLIVYDVCIRGKLSKITKRLLRKAMIIILLIIIGEIIITPIPNPNPNPIPAK